MTGMTIAIALISVILIGAVLIQNPKGGGIDSTFGAGANQMFGASGSANIIEKATWGFAIALFAMCILTAMFF
jgi:preprotein translocase subunit SecG